MTLAVIVASQEHSRRRLARLLSHEGVSAVEAADVASALRITFEARPDAALVDLGVEGGLALVRTLRSASPMPLIAVTDGHADLAVAALDAGADDALPSTCGAQELLARVRAAFRRRQPLVMAPGKGIVRTGALVVDRSSRTVTERGARVRLSSTEYAVLSALAAHLGEVVPHRRLLAEVRGDEYVDDVQYLRVYVGYLRRKIEPDFADPTYLLNHWGVGYRLALLPVELPEAALAAPSIQSVAG